MTPMKSNLISLLSTDETSFSKKGWNFGNKVQLVLCQFKFGNQWAKMMQVFPIKTSNDLKNQFFSITRRCIRKLCRKVNSHEFLSKVSTLKSTTLSQFFNILCTKTSQWKDEETSEETIKSMMKVAFSNSEKINSDSLVTRQIYKQTIADLIVFE